MSDRRLPLGRLTAVELRKAVNTRSGFWSLVGVAALIALFALVNGLDHGGRQATYTRVFHDALQPSAYLLPVLGVLLVCTEWTQRTALTTFTLVPARGRVLAAKGLASLVVSLGALVATVIVAVAFTAAFGHARGGAGTLPVAVIAQGWVTLAGWMLIGLAFGSALLATAPAIVAYLVLPSAANALRGVHGLSGLTRWLSASLSTAPLTLHRLSATQWAHVASALALWIGVPLLVGWRRLRAGDIG
jgi:ABC-type transport system involved in multi-copper enzyme maturation permease subunit